ncbi:hypothetical protein FKM82_024521 [Ascaphus truei]|uniref:C-C motif chemokine 3-like n=1 Tax=Ascaphus truei TaxID=8439 RepID=UPI003F5A42B5
MKVSLVAFSVLLVVMCCSSILAAPIRADTPTSCCFSYAMKPLTRKNVLQYFVTSSRCSKPAVVFITIKGRQVCSDPGKSWVQNYMKMLDRN